MSNTRCQVIDEIACLVGWVGPDSTLSLVNLKGFRLPGGVQGAGVNEPKLVMEPEKVFPTDQKR